MAKELRPWIVTERLQAIGSREGQALNREFSHMKGPSLRLTLMAIIDLIKRFPISSSPSVSYGSHTTMVLGKQIEVISRF